MRSMFAGSGTGLEPTKWLAWLSAGLFIVAVCFVLGEVFFKGIPGVDTKFLFSPPENAGRDGGISSIIISTLLILAICLAASLPLGIGAAVFLSEYVSGTGITRFIEMSLKILAATPSIIFGLFGNAFFCGVLGMGFSILSGGLTLACMVLPVLIAAVRESLRMTPQQYRLGAAALGISKSGLLFRLLLPAAAPGILAGVVLGVGRALAETAALIFTSGYVDRMPSSPMDSGRSLSIHIFDLSMNVPNGDKAAYSSALVLLALILLVNITASSLLNGWAGKNIRE